MGHVANLRLAIFTIGLILFSPMTHSRADEPSWTGEGAYRLLIQVKPVSLEKKTDELPADVAIDFPTELKKLNVNGTPDLATLQIIRYDPDTGMPTPYGDYAFGKSQFDRPFRWYDDAIPYDFPEFGGGIARTKGKIVRRKITRGGHSLGVLGDWQRGRLAWAHSQTGAAPAHYAIYFDLLPEGKQPEESPPCGWIGDGLPRCEPQGTTTTGLDHCRIDLDDWDGDGLIDILMGETYGHVMWWRNVGTAKQPRYTVPRLVLDVDGVPIDSGISCAPKVADWDGDGAKDLLIGCYRNRLIYFRNLGTNKNRKLAYQGMLHADGSVLALPTRPVAMASEAVFRQDYFPIPDIVDWDGDGDLDLLAGGVITGRIFFYENIGKDKAGQPKLTLRGPIEADGKPLNVQHWYAAPCFADFDADGDLDLMTGCHPRHEDPKQLRSPDNFLRYYENIGSDKTPRLVSRPFPKNGPFPTTFLATPRTADWDNDGDLDLIVSNRSNLYLFENVGTPKAPMFRTHQNHVKTSWRPTSLNARQFFDWNKDGRPDFLTTYNYQIRLQSDSGNPWTWNPGESILPRGEFIDHPHKLGDYWFRPYLVDFDRDDRPDILFGTWHGNVWLHRNLSTPTKTHFDVEGTILKLADGNPIKVGPIGKDPTKDFDALQGARTEVAAGDLDGDGQIDVVLGDTYGVVRVYRNATGPNQKLRFAEPLKIGDLGIRLKVDVADWNNDGLPDVFAGAANGRCEVFLNRSKRGQVAFAPGQSLNLPKAILQPRPIVVDLNRDGDADLFLMSTIGSCFVERSFLEHGYAQGVVQRVQRKPAKRGS